MTFLRVFKTHARLLSIVGMVSFILALFALSATQGQEIPPVVLHRESGEVFYKNASDIEFSQLVEGSIEISPQSEVKVGEGSAYVLFSDNSVMSIDAQTEIEIDYKYNDVSIKQVVGNTWHRILNLNESEVNYKVETPTTIAAVRGTKFGVYSDRSGATNIYVKEGEVAVAENTDKEVEVTEKLLREGKMILVREVNADVLFDSAVDISVKIESSNWFKKNVLIDTTYDSTINMFKDEEYKLEGFLGEIMNFIEIAEYIPSESEAIFKIAPIKYESETVSGDILDEVSDPDTIPIADMIPKVDSSTTPIPEIEVNEDQIEDPLSSPINGN
ncbi:FecR domain-containing protein [Candidatus Dojkabacteria bacterium]|uniref:FecR domain-containing protein n=1 Tax=Candidatus Dojkabacteria bacterium TaxID=2099670 RepID=A0A955L7F7_9BACT|nr:FecR domain-containing protein [Candidatus Dojkabacteria bacterium]